ncbi:MAG: hypothetical protein JWN70_5563 [Planctomycetaceae bacterium]|nr:hypothetical protein [Planctomycetaceae bacterium]
MSDTEDSSLPPITELSRAQRRVLGVLVEKGITTPEVYPLTLKSVTTGCNQKSNRDPVANYDEDRVEAVLEELRELGLIAMVYTESGRTPRFRHYMRKRFTVTEPQLAILTELLLRGQQAVGELRTRASRMAPIETLEQLRTELEGLAAAGLVRSDGPLDRRGVEVDHNLYQASEKQPMRARATSDSDAPPSRSSFSGSSPAPAVDPGLSNRVSELESTCQDLRAENASLTATLAALRDDFRKLGEEFHELRRALGG